MTIALAAVAFARAADDLWARGDAELALVEVHALAGRTDDAVAAANAALRSYEAKEHLVGVDLEHPVVALFAEGQELEAERLGVPQLRPVGVKVVEPDENGMERTSVVEVSAELARPGERVPDLRRRVDCRRRC